MPGRARPAAPAAARRECPLQETPKLTPPFAHANRPRRISSQGSHSS